MFVFMALYMLQGYVLVSPNAKKFFQDNESFIGVASLILAISISLSNLITLILFFYLLNFFLNYRIKLYRSKPGIIKSKSLSCFNKFIISWIIFLCLLILWNIFSTIVVGINILKSGVNYETSNLYNFYICPMYKVVIPIKDLLIALSFAFLYYS